MELRVKEIIKSKGITMQEVAEKLGIARVNLTKTINGNPTIETLEKIADALNVDFLELFVPKNDGTTGFIEHKGVVYKINSVSDLENILEEIKKSK